MRKITQQTINAFLNFKPFKSGNTEVHIQPCGMVKGEFTNLIASIYLHGNKIAGYNRSTSELYITNCGWFSNTTKERLNGLPGVRISQKAGKWYLNGNEWNGELTRIK